MCPVESILKHLNTEQQEAVCQIEGPVMVVAGAGSGKTRVLTHRIAYMISKGIDPFNILALTFTNKAAREMQHRISKMISASQAKSVWMGTFHSVFARVLRAEAHHLGFPANFTIYDTDDSKRTIRRIIKEMNLDPKTYTPGQVLHRISSAKSSLISHQEYNQNSELTGQDSLAGRPQTGTIFTKYNNELKRSAAMDFDDLLFNMNLILRDLPKVLYKYQKRFKYILVDEYQDTNYAQYLIIKKLAADNENICVVGDDAQSIYGFRGANIQNILNFRNDYPELKTFKLEQNYRSTSNIVNAANSIIKKNKDQIHKTVWTRNTGGEKIFMLSAATDQQEASMIVSTIESARVKYKAAYSDFAVLYRTNSQSRAVEDALRHFKVPYRVYGGTAFYQRKEVKDMLAYFRLIINPGDRDAFMRIINFPARGIGTTTLNRLNVEAGEKGTSIIKVCEDIQNSTSQVSAAARSRIQDFMTMIKSFRTDLKNTDAYELAHRIASQAGMIKMHKEDNSPEGMARYENLQELLNAISHYASGEEADNDGVLPLPEDTDQPQQQATPTERTLEGYMENIALITDMDTAEQDRDHVSLMTVHGAKGLEFPFVFVAGMEENLFPSMMAMGTRAELEEERRLFYVAVTRAEKQVWISYAETRRRHGSVVFAEPSRFIDEIDNRFLVGYDKNHPENQSGAPAPQRNPQQRSANARLKRISSGNQKQAKEQQSATGNQSAPDSGNQAIREGQTVSHAKFGKGIVMSVEGSGTNTKAMVNFVTEGKKFLLLQYAKLTVLDN